MEIKSTAALVALLLAMPTVVHGQNGPVAIGWQSRRDTAAAATATLADFERERRALSSVLAVPGGYPRIMTSRELPRLKKGQHAIVLGVCQADAVDSPLRILLSAGLSVWTTDATPNAAIACPAPVQGWARQGTREVTLTDGASVIGSAYAREAASGARTLVQLFLWSRSGKLQDSRELPLDAGCTAALSTDQGVLYVDATCPGKPVQRTSWTSVGGQLGPAPGLSARKDVQIVIWGGGRTDAEAQAALEQWNREKDAVSGVLDLPAGFPRIVSSDDFPGLNPGYKIVALGLCPAERLAQPLPLVKAFQPGAYVKTVTASGDVSCPKLAGALVLDQTEQLQQQGRTFTVAKLSPPPTSMPWTLRAWLRDAKGRLLDWKRADQEGSAGRSLGGSCTTAAVLKHEGKIVVGLDCGAASSTGPLPQTWGQRLTFDLVGDRIVPTMKEDQD
jgi:hypothetical protein